MDVPPSEAVVTWQTPTQTFICGACGTTVTNLPYTTDVLNVMTKHDEFCKGFAPLYHETGGDRIGESCATEAGVTPGEEPRVAAALSSGRGE